MAAKAIGVGGIAGFISKESYDKLQAVMYTKKAEKGTYLFWDGDPAEKLYFVIEGRVRISKALDNGRTLTLYLHQKGDLICQLDPFQDSLFSFNAEVTEASRIGIIQRKDLEILLLQHGELAIEFMKWMGLTHRLTQTKLRDLMMFGKTGALCSLLIRLANSYGIVKDQHIEIDLKINNSEMADMIGTARESVNRMLGDLRKENVIDYQEGHIVIKNLAYLRDECRCENCPKEICRM